MSSILERRKQVSEKFLSDGQYPPSFSPSKERTNSKITESKEELPPFELPFGTNKIIFESAPEKWLIPLLGKISELDSLLPNWDSYGALPIRTEAAAASAYLLVNLLLPTDPLPSIVPTPRGSILLEWHEKGIDLEVDVGSWSQISMAFDDGNCQEEIDRASWESIEEKLQILRGRNN